MTGWENSDVFTPRRIQFLKTAELVTLSGSDAGLGVNLACRRVSAVEIGSQVARLPPPGSKP